MILSNTAYSGFFGTLGPGSPDGADGASEGAPQYPDVLTIYPFRPPWHVAGVDYHVGVGEDVVLTDWHDAVIPGSALTAHEVRITGQIDLVLDSIDFSTHGGAAVSLLNCDSTTITRCYFGGAAYRTLSAGIINGDPSCTDLTINYCTFDGGRAGSSSSVLQLNQVGGTIRVEYNYMGFFSQHALSMVCRAFELTTVYQRFNLMEQGAWTPGAHLNLLEWSGFDIIAAIDCSYNTLQQTYAIPAGGEVYQTYCNETGNFVSPNVHHNTIVSRSVSYGAHIEVSYSYHLSGFISGTTVTGTPKLTDNYQDQSAAYGMIYPGCTETDPVYDVSGTTCMITGGVVGDSETTVGVLKVLHIAPVVAGGTTVVSGRVANNGSDFTFSFLDGEDVTYLWSWALSTGGLGASATGYFAFAITTPAVGDHVISVHGTNGTLDYQVPFTVVPSGSPAITIDTPTPAIEGTSQTISGTWADMAAPIGFQYQIDGVGNPVNAAAPVIGDGTWSFVMSAAPAVMLANSAEYVPHTLTVTAYSAGVSATTGIYTNLPALSLTVLAVPNNVPHNSNLTIAGQFAGTLISGLDYALDDDPLAPVSSPTITDGVWSFVILAPADLVTHTITVQGTGANTSIDTSPPFYTSEQIFPPGAPGIPAAFFITPGFLAISWTVPVTGSPVDTYELQYSPHGAGTWTTPTGAGLLTVLRYVLNHLTAATTYDVRVNGTNLGGTGPYGTNSTGITTLATYDDGAAGAPAGVSPQLPTLLDGYPDRPTWNVAGVDYGVGPPAATIYTAWDVYAGTGISHGANFIRIEAVDDVVLDGIDFSASGGAFLNVVNCQRLTVTNCKFGNTSNTWAALIGTDTLSADLTVTYCEMDLSAGRPNTAVIWARGGGTTTVEYVYSPTTVGTTVFTYIGDKAGIAVVRYNVVQVSPFILTQASSGFTLTPTIEFNTVWCPQTFSSSAAIQIGDTLAIASPVIANNTLIATAVSTNISYWFGLASFQTGDGLIYDNWVDDTSTFGAFFGAPSLFTDRGWLLVNNINIVTGNPIA